MFCPEDGAQIRRDRRRAHKRRPVPQWRAEMLRSEQLAAVAVPLWQLRTGRRSELPPWFARLSPEDLAAPLIARICDRLDRVAPRWHALPVGGGITLTWPFAEGVRHPAPVRRIPDDVVRGRRWENRSAARRG
jgi:hypothetical protein